MGVKNQGKNVSMFELLSIVLQSIKPRKQGVVIEDAPVCICSRKWLAAPNCFLVYSQHLYIVKNMCLYAHLCKDCMNYLCYQMVLQVKLFCKSKIVQSIEWIFITGEWVNTTLNSVFYSLFLKHRLVATSITQFLITFFKEDLIGN
jgi:hypothetical protein